MNPLTRIIDFHVDLCGKNKHVEQTALQIIASMKRDWMQVRVYLPEMCPVNVPHYLAGVVIKE